jgi:hypothetical protein
LQRLRKPLCTPSRGAHGYGIPAVRLDGKMLVAFCSTAKHLSFFPAPTQRTHRAELKGFDSDRTVRFSVDHPCPRSSAQIGEVARRGIQGKAERQSSLTTAKSHANSHCILLLAARFTRCAATTKRH